MKMMMMRETATVKLNAIIKGRYTDVTVYDDSRSHLFAPHHVLFYSEDSQLFTLSVYLHFQATKTTSLHAHSHYPRA